MKKLLCSLIILIIALGAGINFAGDYAVKKISETALVKLPLLAEKVGVTLVEPKYETSGYSPLSKASWTGITGKIKFRPLSLSGNKETEYFVGAFSIKISLRGFSFKEALVQIENLSLIPMTAENNFQPSADLIHSEEPFHGKISIPELRLVAKINLFNLDESLKELGKEVDSILRNGTTKLLFDCRGTLAFNLVGHPRLATIITEPVNDTWVLRLIKTDIRDLSHLYHSELTDSEIEIIANYPLRATELLSIREFAENNSRLAAEQDKSIPEDAYRHILWSYKLTQHFGAEFSKEVTDAHEVGARDNTDADKKMDENNNRVGVQYFLAGIPESELAEKVKTDPQITKSAQE